MKVILLQNIKGLGDKFEIKQVKDGYARNFLIPRQLAKIATEQIIKELEAKKLAWEKEEKEIKNKLEALAKDLTNQEFHFKVKTGKSGEVFGSISKDDIKKAILNQIPNDDIDVNLERPLKTLGEHKVEIVLQQAQDNPESIRLRSGLSSECNRRTEFAEGLISKYVFFF